MIFSQSRIHAAFPMTNLTGDDDKAHNSAQFMIPMVYEPNDIQWNNIRRQ
jgi:hypothetical protein